MIQNIVITDRNFDNEPWYALVLKRDNPSKSVVLVKIEMEDVGKFVLWLDPSSASHGSLNIRNFHVCKVGEDLNKIFYEALNEACFSASEDKIFRSYLPQRQAYPHIPQLPCLLYNRTCRIAPTCLLPRESAT